MRSPKSGLKRVWIALTDNYEPSGLDAAPHPGRLKPRAERGEFASYGLVTTVCARGWFDHAPSIGDDLFLRPYSHGAPTRDLVPMPNGGVAKLYCLASKEAKRRDIQVHRTTAWQMYPAANALINSPRIAFNPAKHVDDAPQ